MESHVTTVLDRSSGGREAERHAGRRAARRAAAAALGVGIEVVTIESPVDRAPFARMTSTHLEGRPLPVSLSVSHADGVAVAVASTVGPVGADLEPRLPVPASHVRFFLSEGERSATDLSGIVCWTLKEAAWKALGLTRGDPFLSLELQFERRALVAVSHGGRRFPVFATLTEPLPGYVLATVVISGRL